MSNYQDEKEIAIRYFTASCLAFWVTVLLCLIQLPAVASTGAGVSYFGVYGKTIPLYDLGMAVSAICMFGFSRKLPYRTTIRRAFLGISLCTFALVLTPYTVAPLLKVLHILAGVVLFLVEFAVTFWISYRLQSDFWNRGLFILQLVSGVVAGISLPVITHYEVTSELLFQLAFMIVVLRFLRLAADGYNQISMES